MTLGSTRSPASGRRLRSATLRPLHAAGVVGERCQWPSAVADPHVEAPGGDRDENPRSEMRSSGNAVYAAIRWPVHGPRVSVAVDGQTVRQSGTGHTSPCPRTGPARDPPERATHASGRMNGVSDWLRRAGCPPRAEEGGTMPTSSGPVANADRSARTTPARSSTAPPHSASSVVSARYPTGRLGSWLRELPSRVATRSRTC